jgi:hypothetical protein
MIPLAVPATLHPLVLSQTKTPHSHRAGRSFLWIVPLIDLFDFKGDGAGWSLDFHAFAFFMAEQCRTNRAFL